MDYREKVLENQKNLRENVTEQLVAQRKSKKITQQVLSDITGIQRPNIARIERGNYNPTIDMLVRMANGLGLDVEITFKEKSE